MNTTVPAADFDTAFLEGFAQLLAAAGTATWKADGVYANTDPAPIIIGGLPQSPDGVLALTSYQVSDAPTVPDSVLGLQVTSRAAGKDPRTVGRLDAEVFDALHGLYGVDLPTGIRVAQCLRQSGASLGQDSNQRWRRSSNFYVTVHRPSTHRP